MSDPMHASSGPSSVSSRSGAAARGIDLQASAASPSHRIGHHLGERRWVDDPIPINYMMHTCHACSRLQQPACSCLAMAHSLRPACRCLQRSRVLDLFSPCARFHPRNSFSFGAASLVSSLLRLNEQIQKNMHACISSGFCSNKTRMHKNTHWQNFTVHTDR